MSEYNEVKVRFEDREIRTASEYPDPFPLYPYEELDKNVTSFTFLKDIEALILTATRPFIDTRDGKKERFIGDEYLFKGPGTYIPKIEESIVSRIEALIVLPNNALLLKAKRETVDALGVTRKAGEQVSIFKQNFICLRN
jgi:major vault protein